METTVQNTLFQSWTVEKILTRERRGQEKIELGTTEIYKREKEKRWRSLVWKRVGDVRTR